jgi:hypothetical protein
VSSDDPETAVLKLVDAETGRILSARLVRLWPSLQLNNEAMLMSRAKELARDWEHAREKR